MNIKAFVYRYINHLLLKINIRGRHTKVYSYDASSKAEYGYYVTIGKNVFVDNKSTIGDYSYVNKNTSIQNACIGKYCSISSGVNICPMEHDISKLLTSPVFGNGKSEIQKVVIGNNVLISLNVIIMQGVHIGDGAVIGAGTIVTHDVPPYAVVCGNPGKIIRYRFKEEQIKEITGFTSEDIYSKSVQILKDINQKI